MMNQFMSMVKSGHNPEQLMISLLEQRMKGTPMGDNLISLARSGDQRGIEQIARNMAAQRGMDFDKEFNAFRKKYGL